MVVFKCGPICHACGWGWRNNQHSMLDALNANGDLNRGGVGGDPPQSWIYWFESRMKARHARH
jgi:hypothetical protein